MRVGDVFAFPVIGNAVVERIEVGLVDRDFTRNECTVLAICRATDGSRRMALAITKFPRLSYREMQAAEMRRGVKFCDEIRAIPALYYFTEWPPDMTAPEIVAQA